MSTTTLWLMIICLGLLFINEHFTTKRLYKQLMDALLHLHHETEIKKLAIQISEEVLKKCEKQERELAKLRKPVNSENKKTRKKILDSGKREKRIDVV